MTVNKNNEVATICDKNSTFSFMVIVCSQDKEPQHMHFIYKNDQTDVKIYITRDTPRSIKDIAVVDKDKKLSSKQLEEILLWAQTNSGIDSIKYWKSAQMAWMFLHPL